MAAVLGGTPACLASPDHPLPLWETSLSPEYRLQGRSGTRGQPSAIRQGRQLILLWPAPRQKVGGGGVEANVRVLWLLWEEGF